MEGYEDAFVRHQVERTVLVPFVFREQDIPEENAVVLDYARRDPEHRYPYALLDEADPGFIGRRRREYVGVKEHFVRSRSVLTPEKEAVFEQVRDYGLTLLLHSERVSRGEYILSILKKFPGIKLQIAHMGRGLPGDTEMIGEMLEMFRPYETVTFDTSTIRESWAVERAVDTVGAQRVLYGSDFPFYMEDPGEDIMDRQIQHIFRAKIRDDQREDIFYHNFEHWIKRGE
jgi:predicted TIM-barrel fold metal-dependent hydrolase